MSLFVCFHGLVIFGNVVYCVLPPNGEINETTYNRMPPLFHLDEYEPCIYQPGGVYCSASIDIVSEEPNELYEIIQEYSSFTKIHYNHSRLDYGICLTETCKNFYHENITWDQKHILEACLNDTFYKKYGFGTKVSDYLDCHTADEPLVIDAADIAVAVVVGLIIVLNLIGSFYGFCQKEEKDEHGNKFWNCFSIQRNGKRLLHPTAEDERRKRLKGLHGIRSICMMLVILCHSVMSFVLASDNPHDFEQRYQNYIHLCVCNAAVIVQTFFIMSGFLLVYNLLITEEKRQLQWKYLPQSIILRWLRMTPTYGFMLALTATWLRHAGHGPLWQALVVEEVDDCRRYWYQHILYFQNYFDRSYCMPEGWYLSADFQLYIVGLLIFFCVPRAGHNIAIGLLFIIGLITPAVTTYLLDLDGVLLMSPESGRHKFLDQMTFHAVYKRGHTNIANYALGLGLGAAVYRWQKTDFNLHRYVKSRFIYWATFPAAWAIFLSGSIFYSSTSYPLMFRAVYAALFKPAFGAIICLVIIGMIFKYEKLFRSILEWSGWAVTARVAYSAYCVHFSLIRILAGSRTTLVHTTFFHMTEAIIGAIALSFLLAIPLWLFVEAPVGKLIALWLSDSKPKNTEKLAMDNSSSVETLKSEVSTNIDIRL